MPCHLTQFKFFPYNLLVMNFLLKPHILLTHFQPNCRLALFTFQLPITPLPIFPWINISFNWFLDMLTLGVWICKLLFEPRINPPQNDLPERGLIISDLTQEKRALYNRRRIGSQRTSYECLTVRCVKPYQDVMRIR